MITNVTYPPGARVIIRDEEWLVKGNKPISTGGVALSVVGLSELVRNHHAIFLSTLDIIQELKPEETKLVYKILKFGGVSLKAEDVMQIGKAL